LLQVKHIIYSDYWKNRKAEYNEYRYQISILSDQIENILLKRYAVKWRAITVTNFLLSTNINKFIIIEKNNSTSRKKYFKYYKTSADNLEMI
jgi:hypothetical protein